ncbi:MAG: hypothetical protein ABUK11_01560 [Mariprofundaceae bacterium]
MTLLKTTSRLLKQLLLLVVSLLILSTYSYADTDPRMVVEIVADDEGNLPTVKNATKRALPVLWDRVVADASRHALSDKIRATPFLLRVVPHSDGVQVTFNQQRVWQYLDQHEIVYLKEAPRLNLQIQMINQNDTFMPKTAEALQMYALESALARGVVLDGQAPTLMASWRWIDAAQVNLNVRGGSVLGEFTETRTVKAGDPLVQLQAWVTELLTKVRDAHVAQIDAVVETPAKKKWDQGIEFILTIEQSSTLPEQVVLEDALRQNVRITALIPTRLGATTRQYRILLKGEDDSWIRAWFQRRGMQATATPYGWLVR